MQSGIERLWGETNVKISLPLKIVFLYMEDVLGVINIGNPHHLGACQSLSKAVMRFAVARFVSVWDIHVVRRRARGPPVGRPEELRQQHPHPAGLRALPANVDFVHQYEQSRRGGRLRRLPAWAAARDPLFGQPDRQAARAAAVMQLWGTLQQVWQDVDQNLGRALFIPAYRLFLGFR